MEWQLLSSDQLKISHATVPFISARRRAGRAAGAPRGLAGARVRRGWVWAGREGGLLGGPEVATTDCCARRPVELSQG